MTKFITLRLLAGLIVALVFFPPLWCTVARAAKPQPLQGTVTGISPKIDNKAPIHITSDRMEANQQGRTIIFEGHVYVRQNDLEITAKQLTVTLEQENQNRKQALKKVANGASDPSQRIDYIEFTGNVRVTQQDRVATAQKAIYYQKEQKILLEGSPVVTKGQDKIQGKLITIYLKDNRCVVEGGSGAQVRAVLFPEKKE